MMTEVLVAIAVGFAISVPLTFWLLKKARIKSKVRHFQVSLAVGLPTALFVFLLQTSFIRLVLIVTLFVSVVVVAIELILRYLVRGTRKSEVSYDQGQNGSQVSFDQARIDSGLYPDDYLTEDVWSEMQTFLKQRAQQSKPSNIAKKIVTPIDEINTKRLRGFQIYRYISIKGSNFSVLDGIRSTTDVDKSLCRNQIFIFGGSTVFCDEMPDRLTIASFLQRLINKETQPMAVINCGWSGASVLDRTKMLKDLVEIKSNDRVVFYFGDNDSGWHHSTKDRTHLSEELIPLPVQAMKMLKTTFGFEIAGWVYNELAPKWMRKYSEFAVSATIEALKDANEYCKSRGAEMLVILQPNLYTLRTKYPSEVQAEKRFSNNLKTVIIHAYRRYEEWVKETPYAVSATHIFDNAPAPVFLDWAHVNARGNEIIAKFVFEELQRRGMLGKDSKL
jgi:hypothetical protein